MKSITSLNPARSNSGSGSSDSKLNFHNFNILSRQEKLEGDRPSSVTRSHS
ncbi:hypothetical protein [Phormidium nigroviride]